MQTPWIVLWFITFVLNGYFTEQTVLPGDGNMENNLTSFSPQGPDLTKKKEEENFTFPFNNSTDDNDLAIPILPDDEKANIMEDGGQSFRADEIQILGRTALMCNGSICSNPSFPEIWVNCYCDHYCVLFGDCCVDYFKKLVQSTATEDDINYLISDPVGFYQTYSSSQASIDVNINLLVAGECHQLYLSQASPIILIKQCPYLYSESIEKFDWLLACTDPYADFPVTSKFSIDVQIVYKNKYCAYCNGLREHELLYWGIQAGCPYDIAFSNNDVQSTIYDKCKLLYKPPSISAQPRYCLSRGLLTHPFIPPNTYSASFNICRRYIAPFAKSHDLFQNPHCTQPAGLSTSQSSCIRSLIDFVFVLDNPVELIFNFDINNHIWQLYQPKDNGCQSGIKIQGVCQIPSNIFYISNTTLPVGSKEGTKYSVLIDFRFSDIYGNNLTVSSLQNSEIKWKNKLSMWNVETIPFTNSVNNTLSRDHFILQVQGEGSSFFSDVIHILQHDIELGMTIQMANYQDVEQLQCKENSKLVRSTQALFDTRSYSVVHLMDTFMSVLLEFSRFKMDFKDIETPVITEMLVCKEIPFNLTCEYVILDNRSYDVKNNTVYLIVGHNRRELYVDYEIRNDVLYVCIDIVITGFTSYPVFDILDTLAVCVSILSLLVLLVFHCIYPSLLNLPGKVLFSLAMTLLLSLVLLATMSISKRTNLSCKVVAILSHYFWLCVFHWSAIMAYEFARMFGSKMLQNINNTYVYRFKVYAAIAYGIPLLIITVCIILDQTHNQLSIGYGSNGTCWIHESIARIIFVIVPIGFLLVVEVVFIIIAIHGIQTTEADIAHMSQTRQNRRKCLIFSKLFFILGLTWILTFITSFIKSKELIYVSMFLNSLQGFFLFLIFAVNSRFTTLIKRTFQNKITSTQTNSNNAQSFDQI